MRRLLCAAALVIVSASPNYADDTASPKDILNLMLVTGAVVDYCKLTVDADTGPKMAAELTKYQTQLNISDADLQAMDKQVVDTVIGGNPDCSEDGDLVKAARQLIELVRADQP